jgi:hypothetical protein
MGKNLLRTFAVMFLVALTAGAFAQDPDQLNADVYTTNAEISIDGDLSEVCWVNAEKVKIEGFCGGYFDANPSESDISATFQIVWVPEVGIYLAIEVTDDAIYVYEKDVTANEYSADNIEVFFQVPATWEDGIRSDDGAFTNGSFQIRSNVDVEDMWSGRANLAWGWEGIQQTEYASMVGGEGYTFEAFYPFAMLFGVDGITTKPEDLNETVRELGFEIAVGDAEELEGGREGILTWTQGHTTGSDGAWNNINYFGKISLKADLIEGVATINEGSVKVYPNPVADVLKVEGVQNKIEILNVLGQNVITMENVNGTVNIPVNGLEKGVYVVRIDEEMSQKVMIK